MANQNPSTSQDLPLSSFEVEGYRAIRHLQLPELERVNLFVGLNNVGKTSLLEAIRLYMSRNPRVAFATLVRERSDLRPGFSSVNRARIISPEEIELAIRQVEHVFHGSFSGKAIWPIRIGPAGLKHDVLDVELPWMSAQTDIWASNNEGGQEEVFVGPETPLVRIERAGRVSTLNVEWFLRRYGVVVGREGPAISTSIPAGGFDSNRLTSLWDYVARQGYVEDVENALRTVVPELERLHLLGESSSGGRSVAVALSDRPRPVPLRSMGDGLNRVFGIALALVKSQGGVVLIDEIENGLHYSVQDEVWRAVFHLARQLNVQVFATTHSWDTIVGFQYAANLSEDDGILYRLDARAEGRIEAVRYTEREVEIAAEQRIEVR